MYTYFQASVFSTKSNKQVNVCVCFNQVKSPRSTYTAPIYISDLWIENQPSFEAAAAARNGLSCICKRLHSQLR